MSLLSVSRYDTKAKNHDKSIKLLGSNGDVFSSAEYTRNIRIQEDGCRVSRVKLYPPCPMYVHLLVTIMVPSKCLYVVVQ